MEFEAQGMRFEIDHYKPQASHRAGVADYSNLMWACEDCNNRKSDYEVPREAAEAGFRFFKADIDSFYEHFQVGDDEISGLTNIGTYTDTMLNLNREKLKKIRALRREANLASDAIIEGINGLRRLQIDQLPVRSKGEVSVKRGRALEAFESMQDRIDDILREFAHSSLVDRSAPEVEAQKGRRELLKELGALYPGRFRGRDASE